MTDATTTTAVTAGPTTAESKAHFWEMLAAKAAAALLTALYATGVIPTTGPWMTAAAIGATVLGYLGFAVSRTKVALA